MDLFELFETDRERRGRRSTTVAARSNGSRGFFRRWLAMPEDDEHDDERSAQRRVGGSRRYSRD
ncbi:MAG: hypothetical protein AB7P41_05445 [Dehalococcoidia bacterium]